MNQVILNGTIWGISNSHMIGDVQYQKANLTVKNSNGRDSVITIQFKQFQGSMKNGEVVQVVGNLRSYSKKLDDDKNRVSIYVFTYFDQVDSDKTNFVQIDGRLCKIEPMRYTNDGKNLIHFILANNIIQSGTKLNSYIPCIAWGKCAKRISKCNINDTICLTGELRSREYKKPLLDNQFEIRVAHELVVNDFEEM